MHNFVLIVICSLIFFSCKEDKSNVFKGHQFEIDYLEARTITQNDWIEIDGMPFRHYRYEEELLKNPYALPATSLVRDSTSPDRKFVGKYNRISIAIKLGEYIHAINRTDSSLVDHDSRYIITNKPFLLTHGKLRFHREDSSEITVKASKDYPARITPLEFE